jgi:hypothetical protein
VSRPKNKKENPDVKYLRADDDEKFLKIPNKNPSDLVVKDTSANSLSTITGGLAVVVRSSSFLSKFRQFTNELLKNPDVKFLCERTVG